MKLWIWLTLGGVAAVLAIIGVVAFRRRRAATKRQRVQDATSLSATTEMMGANELHRRDTASDHAIVLGQHIDPDNPADTNGDVVMDVRYEASLVIGPPGSGKTTSLLAPAIIRHDGPVFGSTTKGDVISSTLRAREARGGQIAIFDPADLLEDAAGSDPVLDRARQYSKIWTPLTEATTWPRAQKAAQAMVTATAGQGGAGGSTEQFFTLHSTNLVAALLMLYRTKPGASLADLIDRVEVLGGATEAEPEIDDEGNEKKGSSNPWKLLMTELQDARDSALRKAETLANGGHEEAAARKKDAALGLRQAALALKTSTGASQATDTLAGIIGAVGQLITGWTMSPKVTDQPWDAETTFSIEQLEDDHTVYMTCPIVEHRPLANAFVGSYMDELQRRATRAGGRLAQRHLVVLDELVYCTPHSDMLSWANNLARSAGIKLLLGTQALSDLEITWGEDQSRSLFNSSKGSKILLAGATDSKALDEFSTLAGKQNLVQVSSVTKTTGTSRNYKGAQIIPDDGVNKQKSETVTESVVERDSASPARLAAMPADTALAWLPGEPGLRGGTVQVRLMPIFAEGTDLKAASQGDPGAVQRVSRPPSQHTRSVNLDNPLGRALKRKPGSAQ